MELKKWSQRCTYNSIYNRSGLFHVAVTKKTLALIVAVTRVVLLVTVTREALLVT